MKIAVAQIQPVVGPVEGNLARHTDLIEAAVRHHASLIVFPELSLTGYAPLRAAELARSPDDPAFACLQRLADDNDISVGAGFPICTGELPEIGCVVYRPRVERITCVKQFLHPDEQPWFRSGRQVARGSSAIISDDPRIALAICYELSVPEHAQSAADAGAVIYIASVAKTAGGVERAWSRLEDIAGTFSMFVMMSNSLGEQGGDQCAGRSAVWNRSGQRIGELDDQAEGILVLDIQTGVTSVERVSPGATSTGRN